MSAGMRENSILFSTGVRRVQLPVEKWKRKICVFFVIQRRFEYTGEVYRVNDPELKRDLAIKVLRRDAERHFRPP